MEKEQMIKLLESQVESIVLEYLNERKKTKSDNTSKKVHPDRIQNKDSFKRQYQTIQKELSRPEIDATQIMARALGFDPKDDTARSHAFKKLHRKKTPDGTERYEFSSSEIGKISNALQSV